MVVEEKGGPERDKSKREFEEEFQQDLMEQLAPGLRPGNCSMTTILNRGCPGIVMVTEKGTFVLTVEKISNAVIAP